MGLNSACRQITNAIVILVFSELCAAQIYSLGPHNLRGRGCPACHVLHTSGTPLVDVAESDAQVLWGSTLDHVAFTSVSNQTIEVPASMTDPQDPLFHTAVCLTCHDGSVAIVGMIGRTFDSYEAVAQVSVENLELGKTYTVHPVHVPYLPNTGCGLPTPTCNPNHWPSKVDAQGALTWVTDNLGKKNTENFGRALRFYSATSNGGQAMVECSTCHNPHSVDFAETRLGNGQWAVTKSRHFVRGWYDAEDKKSDSVSRFCRSCHYSSSNEYVAMRD
ncbi:MAG TPA: hypothetical protein VEK84_10390 [Terriglobales bacterium]|nr:hypothetical protein [Terriglobales bacterium]